MTLSRIAVLAACMLSLGAQGAELVNFRRVNVLSEKKNVDITFKAGAAGTIGDAPTSVINGLQGVTSEFGGQELPVFIIFDKYLSDEEASKYLDQQFRLEGVVHCAIAQKGNSPDIPSVKLAVLAQKCVMKKINV